MSNDTPQFPLEPGDELHDESSGSAYNIQAVDREYQAVIDDGDVEETNWFPEDYLQRKVERGELTTATATAEEEEEEEDDSEEVPCPDDGCDRTFESEQGAQSHATQVHGDDGD